MPARHAAWCKRVELEASATVAREACSANHGPPRRWDHSSVQLMIERREVDRSGFEAARLGIALRRIETKVQHADAPDDEIALLRTRAPHRDIRFATGEVDQVEPCDDLERDAGIVPAKFAQIRRDAEDRQILCGRQAHPARRAQITPERLPLDRQHRFLHILGLDADRLAALRQHVAAAAALEQSYAEPRLQVRDPPPDRGRAGLERARCFSEAAGSRHRQEVLEIVPFHEDFRTENRPFNLCCP